MVVVRGDLAWRKLEFKERRKEKKGLAIYGKMLQEMDTDQERLTKVIAEKLKKSNSVGWIQEWYSFDSLEKQVNSMEDLQYKPGKRMCGKRMLRTGEVR